MRFAILSALVLAALAVACRPVDRGGDPVAALFSREGAEWIDLTHAFDDSTIFWPTARPFELEVVSAGVTEAGYYYAANNFCMAEHGGTHLDAPIHFAEGRHTADEIPLERTIGPAIVVDVSDAAAGDPDYRASVMDFEAWEEAHGRIRRGAIVLLRTGWADRWPDPARYLGTVKRGPEAVPELHFPGLHPDAATWLAERRAVSAVGIDTPSIDYGQSTRFMSHRILYERNIPGFENVANLDRLPATGAYVVALPTKIAGGSGGPLRIVAVVPEADRR